MKKVSEKRTQVYFPESLYRQIAKRARTESKSSAQIIREAVTEYLVEKKGKQGIDWDNDPLFKAVGIMKSGIKDLSTNHDHYLYGMPKKAKGVKR